MQIYIYVYIDIYVWSYTNNRSVVHLDSDCTQHPSAVPRGPGSSSLWSPVVLGKLGFLSFVLRDQEQHQCGRTWNHRALGGAGHHSGWLHTLHRALVCHPPEQHLSGRAVSAQHSCSLAAKPPPVPRALCGGSQDRATVSPAVPATCSPWRHQLLIPLHPNILVPFGKILVFQGWVGFCVSFINKLDYFNFIQT